MLLLRFMSIEISRTEHGYMIVPTSPINTLDTAVFTCEHSRTNLASRTVLNVKCKFFMSRTQLIDEYFNYFLINHV